jgi:Ni/Fe-hydrogenase subunit HybB-like protein
VLSVHSVVSFDFAVSQLPGWHTTIFPPYFVAGAIFGGFAMVVTLAIPARSSSGSRTSSRCGTWRTCCKIILLTGSIVGYAYLMEFFIAWYSGSPYEQLHLPEPRPGPVRLGLLDDDHSATSWPRSSSGSSSAARTCG